MSSLRFRVGGLIGAVILVAAMGALLGGSAWAYPTSVLLTPAPGSSATGGGSVFTDPTVQPTTLTINLANAKANTTFLVSSCSSASGCKNNGTSDQITTNAQGAIEATVMTPVASPLTLVTVTDVASATDSYQAAMASFGYAAPATYTAPSNAPIYYAPTYTPATSVYGNCYPYVCTAYPTTYGGGFYATCVSPTAFTYPFSFNPYFYYFGNPYFRYPSYTGAFGFPYAIC